MKLGIRRLASNKGEIRFARRRVKVAAIAVLAGGLSLLSFASPVMAATPSTLAVAVVGPGAVTSAPAGINCPAKCSASFAPGTSVVLTAKAKSGAQFLRWGGSCAGAAGCSVKVSGLAVVGAQFAGPTATVQPAGHSVAVPGVYVGTTPRMPKPLSSLHREAPVSGTSRCRRRLSTVYRAGAATSICSGFSRQWSSPTVPLARRARRTACGSATRPLLPIHSAGNLQAATATGAASGTGAFRENISYNNGTTYQCTTNNQTWTDALLVRSSRPRWCQRQGNYSGTTRRVTGDIHVAPGGRSEYIYQYHALSVHAGGSGQLHDQVTIAHGIIKPDGSFSATGSQAGVFQGKARRSTTRSPGTTRGLGTTGVPQALVISVKTSRTSANGVTYIAPLITRLGRRPEASQTRGHRRALQSPVAP